MLERHVEEHALGHGGQRLIEAGIDRFLREGEGHGILREGLGGAAMDLARELIEDDDLGEAAMRGGAPAPGFATGHGGVGIGEFGRELGIEIGGRRRTSARGRDRRTRILMMSSAVCMAGLAGWVQRLWPPPPPASLVPSPLRRGG